LIFIFAKLQLSDANLQFNLVPRRSLGTRMENNLITKITGQLVALHEDVLELRVGAFEYEVLIPEFARRRLQTELNQEITLHTIEYIEGSPMQGRMTPRLIGFLSEIEREFFELFCSVDGVGVKKALRSMVRPVKEVATAIEEQDAKSLSSLPGIGAAMAERIIAKLRRKVPKFALLVGGEEKREAEVETDVISETYEVLRTLGHSESEARRLLDAALSMKKKYKDVQSLIEAIYQQNKD
jgi:holliday junction DNA helicase RuvA